MKLLQNLWYTYQKTTMKSTKCHGILLQAIFIMLIVIAEGKPLDDKCENSDCHKIRMPLLDNQQAALIAMFDVTSMNAQLKDYISYTLNSTFKIQIEQELEQVKNKLRSEVLGNFSEELKATKNTYDKEITLLITNANKNLKQETESLLKQISTRFETYGKQLSDLSNQNKEEFAVLSKAVQTDLNQLRSEIDENWQNIEEWKNNITLLTDDYINSPSECIDISEKLNGIYTVSVDKIKFHVRCETGGWTVIQKRFNGNVEFFRNWTEYENGFGDLNGEFWLGNKYIALLTSRGVHELRIDLEDWGGNKAYAVYNNFKVGDASTKYQLTVSGYSGTAGDGMVFHNSRAFSTYDQDNDQSSINCANNIHLKGAWWYNNCWRSSLNGRYTDGKQYYEGIRYLPWKSSQSLKKSSMMIRKL